MLKASLTNNWGLTIKNSPVQKESTKVNLSVKEQLSIMRHTYALRFYQKSIRKKVTNRLFTNIQLNLN
ncbi:MAG: hypothetical protein VYB18_02170 [Thermodesulfobacteriota bacterium]|jgi:hypothetical protein|nr:hypothetical protein [Thermodesulfobacteriota bacterium]